MELIVCNEPVGPDIRDLKAHEASMLEILFGLVAKDPNDPKLLPTLGCELAEKMLKETQPGALASMIDCLRLMAPAVLFDPVVVTWTSYLCKDNQQIALWGYALCHLSHTRGFVTMEMLGELMPNGVPSDARYQRLFKVQREVLATEEAWRPKE